MLARQAFAAARAPRILVTGGFPKGTPCSVADSMRRLLVQLGVPADRIDVETAARSTWDNARFSDPILRRQGVTRIVLVTDMLHMRRAEACFRALGYEIERASVPVSEGHYDNVSMLAMGLRETVAYGYYSVKGRLDRVGTVEAAPSGSSAVPAPPEPVTRAPIMPAQPTSRTSPDGPLVILGASYAKGWSPSVAGRRVVNRGIQGQQSWELAARFDRDVLTERPRAVVIWGFINDVVRSPVDQMPATLERVRSSVATIVAASRAHGIEPVLATELTITHPDTWTDSAMATLGWMLGRKSYQDYINAHVTSVNAWLRDYARREGLLLLDLHAAVSDSNGRRQRAFAVADGSHVSAAGYTAMSRYAEPLLVAQLARP
jgi:lysophospholipase L1-like esterase